MNCLENYYKNSLLMNLCGEYKNAWKAAKGSKEQLIRLSLCQQAIPHVCNFAYMGKGLTRDYLLSEFTEEINGKVHMDCDSVQGYSYRLFVGFEGKIDTHTDVTSLMWCHNASILVPKYKCPVIYVSNKSNIHVECEGFNYLRIYLMDESTVTVDSKDMGTVAIIYKYSDECRVNEAGSNKCKINQFRKEVRL